MLLCVWQGSDSNQLDTSLRPEKKFMQNCSHPAFRNKNWNIAVFNSKNEISKIFKYCSFIEAGDLKKSPKKSH